MIAAENMKQTLQVIRPSDHIVGSHYGVIIVEYGDFECPSCVKAYPEVKRLQQMFAGEIGFVFRHFPHPDIHPHSEMAAEAAEAAGAQEKFWPMHDLLFQNYQRLENAHLREYAESIGLDLTRYDAEMAEHIYLLRVQEHLASGRSNGVKATPAFFVNEKRVNTDDGLANLFAAVKSEIAKY
jgi:protein-disulfide isomerase